MAKLEGQAFDTEKFYSELGAEKMEEYAELTGIQSGRTSLDFKVFLKIMKESFEGHTRTLEVGCGYGRIGMEFLYKNMTYYGIDLHGQFIYDFRKKLDESKRNQIFHGNFLDFEFPFKEVDCVLFPWSVIGDFNSEGGQLAALEKASLLLSHSPYYPGRILIDIPSDVINKFEGYVPGNFRVHEIYDLSKLELGHVKNHPYKTLTGRNREIIELIAK